MQSMKSYSSFLYRSETNLYKSGVLPTLEGDRFGNSLRWGSKPGPRRDAVLHGCHTQVLRGQRGAGLAPTTLAMLW